jgi:hypothetical protein
MRMWTRMRDGRGCGQFVKHKLLPPSPLLTSRNLRSLLDRDTFRLAHLDVDISLLHVGSAVLSKPSTMCPTGSTETGSTWDLGSHDLDKSSLTGVVKNASPPLLEVTASFSLRVVVLDFRINKVFVNHIVEASVHWDGLVNNGGINGCWWSEGGWGEGGVEGGRRG